MIISGLILLWFAACWFSTNAFMARIKVKVPRWRKLLAWGLLICGIACALSGGIVHAETIHVPDVNAHLRLIVEQAAADEWGVEASPARLAAQLHQESSWNPRARSAVGAEGLAQIMPATGRWLAQQFPDLGAYDPWDPAWSARAAALYDHWLLTRNPGRGQCSNWAFALSAYNGGEKALQAEQGLTGKAGRDRLRWYGGNVADYRARSLPAWRENRDYVQHILVQLEPAYIGAGWAGQAVCV